MIHVLIKLPGDYYNIWYFELTTLHNQTIQLLGNIRFHKLDIMLEKTCRCLELTMRLYY